MPTFNHQTSKYDLIILFYYFQGKSTKKEIPTFRKEKKKQMLKLLETKKNKKQIHRKSIKNLNLNLALLLWCLGRLEGGKGGAIDGGGP